MMNDLASINAVSKEVVERPPTECATAEHPTGCQHTLLAADAAPFEVLLQRRNTPPIKVSPENETHTFGLLGIDDQFPVFYIIAERDGAPHPHALAA
jgi:hypothetical protein